MNMDCDEHFWPFWMGAEMFQTTLVLIYCTYGLHDLVGYACFLPWLFVAGKMGFDLSTRKWRDGTWSKVGKARDARSNEINQTFKNIKTLKLYAWQSFFAGRISERRDLEESLIFKGEAKN